MSTDFLDPTTLVTPVAGYLAAVNLLALGLYVTRRAGLGEGEWGRPETRTLFLAIMGGWFGAAIGRLLFRPRGEPRGFGLALGLSVVILPVLVALPFLIDAAPGLISTAVANYSAQFAGTGSADDKISPLGAAAHSATPAAQAGAQDATGVVAASGDTADAVVSAAAGDAVASVETAAQTSAKQAALPKKFGPATTHKGKAASVGKFLTVGN